MSPREIVESIDIAAPPSAVWAAVSDPCSYGRWSPEATGATRRSGSGTWAVGDRFTGHNRRLSRPAGPNRATMRTTLAALKGKLER